MKRDHSVHDAAALASARELPRAATPAVPLPAGYKLPFFAPFCYSPRGTSFIAQRSRRLRDLVKRGDIITLTRATTRIARMIAAGTAPNFFGTHVTLIPVPRRTPEIAADPPTAPQAIARALLAARLGDAIWLALRRNRAIPKSAWSRPGTRPEFLEHYTSLELIDRQPRSLQFLLVDDFVTRGRTLLGTAAVLHQAFPQAELRAFALVRTEGLNPDITAITAPATGTIRYLGGDAFRSP